MPERRLLSLWFPRLAAERVLRLEPALMALPFAIAETEGNAQSLASLSLMADRAGLRRGMALTDARALCPDLLTRPADVLREAAFLTSLRRWAGKFSPWVTQEGAESLILDISGCAHLFGGEQGLAASITADCARLGLTQRMGIADTAGAAWAMARFAGSPAEAARSGDAIDQEARATRSRAVKRRNWERGGPAPALLPRDATLPRIVPPGQTRAALSGLPVAALRIDPATVAGLVRLGLRSIGDIAGTPRGALARRFGIELVRRLDQAHGSEPEPISPARPETAFAVRLTLPEPVGQESDYLAGLDRLLQPLCDRLKAKGQGARRVRFCLYRVDHSVAVIEVGLARPTDDPVRIRPLLALKTGAVEAGFGIDILRLEASVTEPLSASQHKGHLDATEAARARHLPGGGAGIEALLNRIGTRVGMEAITRLAPADSHIPEKSAQVLAAAWSTAVPDWPTPLRPRPLTLTGPELLTPLDEARPPQAFRWRRREFTRAHASGPERIAPEWWLDDPAWRSGPRDYWRIETSDGTRLWIFEALGGDVSGGWFVHGDFG